MPSPPQTWYAERVFVAAAPDRLWTADITIVRTDEDLLYRRMYLRIGNLMPETSYREDPLTPGEREEYETDLISFSDRQLDLLGDIRGLDILYAGGVSLLWIEGLSECVGPTGSVTALELDPQRVEASRELLREIELPSPVQLVVGDVFRPPFAPGTFDLAYSAGLFHELGVRERPARDALVALASVVRTGGRISTSDFINSVPAVQLEDEDLQRELAREVHGAELYGIGPPERLVTLYEALLSEVWWRISPPHHVRHLDKLVLTEEKLEELPSLPAGIKQRLCRRRKALQERIEHEGYDRAATLYIEGLVING